MPTLLTPHLRALLHKPAIRYTAIGLAALLLLYCLAGYVALPLLIKSQLAKVAEEKFHRKASIAEVAVNPFALTLSMSGFKLTEPDGDAVFAAFDTLRVNLSTESLLRLAPVVQELRLTKPYVRIERRADSYNVDDLIDAIASQPASARPARYSVNNIQVEDGHIEFQDRPGRALHVVSGLKLGLPFISSLPSDVAVFVEPLLSAQVNGAPLHLSGKARPFADLKDAAVEFDLNGMDLTSYLGYLPLEPGFKVRGARLDLRLAASFRQFKEKPPALTLNGNAALKSLELLGPDGKTVLQLPELAVTLRDARPFGEVLEIAHLALNGVTADLRRDRDGNFALPGMRSASGPSAPKSAMRFAIGELNIRDANLRFQDESAAGPLRATVEKLDLALGNVSVDTGKRTAAIAKLSSERAAISVSRAKPAGASKESAKKDAQAASDAPYTVDVSRIDIANWEARVEDASQAQPAAVTIAPLRLTVRGFSTAAASKSTLEVKATVNKTGQLSLAGSLGFAPLQTDLAVEMDNVDLLPLQPYIADRINLRFTRAGLSTKGRLQFEQAADGALKGGFKGDLSVDNVASVDKGGAEELLRWKSLAARAVDVRLQPLAIAVDQVALTDFFTRLIIDSSGRFNLQDLVRDRGQGAPAARTGAPAGAMPAVTIRRFALQGGRVRFTDNFIRPNYSTSLTNLGGTVSGLSSDVSTSAGVDLRGEVNRAPLTIAGRINPLRKNLFLDIKASVRGMEMAPLSAYADRYIGYGIEKGKLSFDVAYRVEDRRLSAENRLILDQLTFGARSERPDAARLPVQFAMALLRDRNGVVDINVPVGGSLDDPQFSIGGIILKVIGNAIMKAVTQPFALLGSIFGGGAGEKLSSLAFDPGRAAVPPAQEDKLHTLAKALADRPGLRLEITGHADPETDSAGLKRASIDRKVRALKVKDMAARGENVAPASVAVSTQEYPALLARVYREEKFDKPRNVLGMPRDIPVSEMERLMLADTTVDEDDLAGLANRRAQAVKDWLARTGQVSGDRLFILASRVGGEGADGKVDFSLR